MSVAGGYANNYLGGYSDGLGVPTFPVVTVSAAFGQDPFTSNPPVWTPLVKVEAVSIDTGREREEGRAKAGTATITVRNDDRRYDPENTFSPLTPNVQPGVKVQVAATWGGDTFHLFTGFVDEWPQTYESSWSARVDIPATDAFGQLAAIDLAESVFATVVRDLGPSAWYRLGETGEVAADSTDGNRPGQYQPVSGAPQGSQGAPGLIEGDKDGAFAPAFGADQRVSIPYSTLIDGYPFTVCATIRAAYFADDRVILDARNLPVAATGRLSLFIGLNGKVYAEVNGGSTVAALESVRRVDDGQVHNLAWVVANSTDMRLYIDGALDKVVTLTSSFPQDLVGGFAIGNRLGTTGIAEQAFARVPGDALDEVVIFDRALTGTEVAAMTATAVTGWGGQTTGQRVGAVLDLVGWPAAARDLQPGNTVLTSGSGLGGSALDAVLTAGDAEDGLLHVAGDGDVTLVERFGVPFFSSATFSDTNEGVFVDALPYEQLEPSAPGRFIRNRVTVTPEGLAPQLAVDTASKDRYGLKTYERGPLPISQHQATDAARHILGRYKDPHTRFNSITLKASGLETAMWPQMLGRKLGDVITVYRRPQDVGSAFGVLCRIEGIAHEFTGTDWETTWALSPATQVTYWTLGTSTLGTSTRLAY